MIRLPAALAFAALAVTLAFGGYLMRRINQGFHIAGMGLSYVAIVTAFYVDNGKNLPLWRALPQIAFWCLPAVIGAPIIAYALLRHPLARHPPGVLPSAAGFDARAVAHARSVPAILVEEQVHQAAQRLLPQLRGVLEIAREPVHRAMGGETVAGIKVTPSLVLGYGDQDMSQLPAKGSPQDFIGMRFKLPDARVTALLAAAGFPVEKQGKPISTLSFGQRSRLGLLALRLTEPNFYLLDEPTNHVDIAGQEALESEILRHEATTILVSHDRRFVRNVGTRFLEIRGRRLVEVDGPEAFFEAMAQA